MHQIVKVIPVISVIYTSISCTKILVQAPAMQKHFENVTSNLQRFRLDGFLCDTILTAGITDVNGKTSPKEYRAHSALLAAFSPVFHSAFADNSNPGWRQIHLPDVDGDALEVTLEFVYTGRLVLPIMYNSSDRLLTLLTTMRDLQITLDCLNGCEVVYRYYKI